MVALSFSDSAYPIHKVEGLPEVGKAEVAGDVVFVDDSPVRHLRVQGFQFRSLQRGYAATAGSAGFAGEAGHEWFLHRVRQTLSLSPRMNFSHLKARLETRARMQVPLEGIIWLQSCPMM